MATVDKFLFQTRSHHLHDRRYGISYEAIAMMAEKHIGALIVTTASDCRHHDRARLRPQKSC